MRGNLWPTAYERGVCWALGLLLQCNFHSNDSNVCLYTRHLKVDPQPLNQQPTHCRTERKLQSCAEKAKDVSQALSVWIELLKVSALKCNMVLSPGSCSCESMANLQQHF